MSDTTFVDPFNTLSFTKDQSSLLGTDSLSTGSNIFEEYAKSLSGAVANVATPQTIPASSDTASGPSTSTSATTSGSGFDLGDWFGRGVIVVLGFIFVGVGLNMFKSGTVAVPKI